MSRDAIVALSSPPGGGERAVVRVSGPGAFRIAQATARRGVRKYPAAPLAHAWSMPAPHSYTGEDTVEIHLPASPPLVRNLIDRLVRKGARLAGPGEFTRRAFLNGRLDLPQAEAVARIIRAGSDEELTAAAALLQGVFSREIRRIEERLLDLCAEIEASIDFVDQDIEILAPEEAQRRASAIRGELGSLAQECRVLEIGADAPTVFLVGNPNAGKSTLFNALVGGKSITSPEAGTTRDLLEGNLDGIRLFDAPGLTDRAASDVDRLAQDRLRAAMVHADLWLQVVSAADRDAAPETGHPAIKVVSQVDRVPLENYGDAIPVSAVTGQGLDALKSRLDRWRREESAGPGARFHLTRRQMGLMRESLAALDRTGDALGRGETIELVALEARAALEPLGAITGRRVDDAILDRIFERFCLGK